MAPLTVAARAMTEFTVARPAAVVRPRKDSHESSDIPHSRSLQCTLDLSRLAKTHRRIELVMEATPCRWHSSHPIAIQSSVIAYWVTRNLGANLCRSAFLLVSRRHGLMVKGPEIEAQGPANGAPRREPWVGLSNARRNRELVTQHGANHEHLSKLRQRPDLSDSLHCSTTCVLGRRTQCRTRHLP